MEVKPGFSQANEEFTGEEIEIKVEWHAPRSSQLPVAPAKPSLLLLGLLGGLGGGTRHILRGGGLDDTNSNSLPHVPDGEPSKGSELAEGLNAHGLGGHQLDDGSISRLDELGVVLNRLAGTTVNLLLDLGELAGNVGGVAVEHRAVAVGHLTGVVQHDDLGGEVSDTSGGLVLRVGGNISSLDVLDRDVLDVEANVVSRDSLREGLVVHLDRLNLSGQLVGGESDDDTRLDDTSLNTTHGHCSNTSNFVDVLEGKPKRLVGGPRGRDDGIEGLKEGGSRSLALLPLNGPALVPGHLLAGLQHVVSVPSGDGDEGNSGGVVANLLDESRNFLLDFLEPSLAVGGLGRVHLVDGNDQLLHSQGVGEQGVLSGLPVLGDTGLKLSSTRGNDKHTTVSLGGTSDHVLDEVTMSRSVDDGDVVLGCLELPESDIDGDSTLTLSLELVEHPGILEGSLAGLLGFLLELLNGPLVDSSALVDQMTGSGGLAGVDVSDDNDVDVDLFLSHVGT